MGWEYISKTLKSYEPMKKPENPNMFLSEESSSAVENIDSYEGMTCTFGVIIR